MKKIFVLLTFLLFFVNNCFAADWEQVADKTWFDLSSWRKDEYMVSGWFKDLNPGNWDLEKNKKVWYRISLFYADCSSRQIYIKTSISYDLKGNVINSFTDNFYTFDDIIPGSVGEWKYTVLCNMR